MTDAEADLLERLAEAAFELGLGYRRPAAVVYPGLARLLTEVVVAVRRHRRGVLDGRH